MAYTPTEWKKGDVVTSEKLNKLEGGVAGAGGQLFVDITFAQDYSGTLSETFGTIKEAFLSGKQIWIRQTGEYETTYFAMSQIAPNVEGGGGSVWVFSFANSLNAADDTSYPTDAEASGDML